MIEMIQELDPMVVIIIMTVIMFLVGMIGWLIFILGGKNGIIK